MDFSSDGAGGSLTESPLGAIARGKIVALRCEGERGVPTCARVLLQPDDDDDCGGWGWIHEGCVSLSFTSVE